MSLTKTFFARAVAAILAASCLANDQLLTLEGPACLASGPAAIARRVPDVSAEEGWAEAADEQREASRGLIDPLVSRASGEVAPAAPKPSAENATRAAKARDVITPPPMDPYLAPMPGGNAAPKPDASMDVGNYASRNRSAANTTYIDQECASQTGPFYSLTIDALLWRLEPTRGRPMMINPLLGPTIRTDDVDLGFQAGPRLSIECMSDEEETIHSLEISYFGVYNWFGKLTDVAPAGSFLRLPDALGNAGVTNDFSAANSMQAAYNARLNSVEMNVFFGKPHAAFTWALGPRFIRLEERFNLDSFTAGRVSAYDVRTQNDLWGAQWVGRWRRTRGCWELTGICKLGIYDNQAQQSTLLTDTNHTVVLRDMGAESYVASFALDAGITAAYQFNATWLARVGYNVFLLDNVARAPDQLDFSNNAASGSRLFFRQDALAHGLNFGLEARW